MTDCILVTASAVQSSSSANHSGATLHALYKREGGRERQREQVHRVDNFTGCRCLICLDVLEKSVMSR
jgi:hypothetical protein